jgi:hypothetical protein
MDRRGFLSALIAAGTAATIDPDKLLWEPGRKLISIPRHRMPRNFWYCVEFETFSGKQGLDCYPPALAELSTVAGRKLSLDDVYTYVSNNGVGFTHRMAIANDPEFRTGYVTHYQKPATKPHVRGSLVSAAYAELEPAGSSAG